MPEFSCTILIQTNLITFYKIALNTTTHGLHIGFHMAFRFLLLSSKSCFNI